MGIQGLLPQLRSIMQPIHVQDLRGQTVAVDTYSWLHKGAVYCSLQLCKGIPTTKHIDYCMHRVKLLQHHGVKPILVFDGGLLPMKIDQETKRARKRKENLERALEHEAAGNSGTAFNCYQKAVDISPSIAFELIQVLKQEKVDYVVAPYEADAQMTYLYMQKFVDAVITEDSDLIPFGCSRIIFKMDKFGQGVEFRSSMLERNKDLDFTKFSKQMILEMCILSGCDYLSSLPGMGLKRAHALIQKHESYEKVIKHLRYSGVSIPPSYDQDFKKAVWAFQHQRVYDRQKRCTVHLSDVPQDMEEDLDFLGPWLPPELVESIAKGDVDPITKLPFQMEIAKSVLVADKTVTVNNIEAEGKRKRLELPVQKNIMTNYFCLASIQARRTFRAPKVMPKILMESFTPSSDSPDSDLPDSDEIPLSSAANQLLNSRHSNDELPMEDNLPDRCNEFLKISFPERSIVKRCPRPLLESYQCAVNEKSHEKHGIELKRTSIKNTSVKRSFSTSSFFNDNSSPEVGSGNQNEVSCKNKENEAVALNDRPTSLKISIKRPKLGHHYDVNKEIPALAGQENRISSLRGVGKDENTSFGRNISHVNDYCGIAEKSMDRFVSLMNSFRYIPSGSRASGLRAPLKDVRNTSSKRLNKEPVDFSKFAYQPGKNKARANPSLL